MFGSSQPGKAAAPGGSYGCFPGVKASLQLPTSHQAPPTARGLPAPPTGGVGRATREATLHPRLYASCFLAGCLILLCPSMEGARPPSPGDELELSVIQGQPDEQAPLNGAVQGIFALEEEPCPVQVRSSSLWRRFPTGSEPGCRPGPGPGTAQFPVSSQLSGRSRPQAPVVRAGIF